MANKNFDGMEQPSWYDGKMIDEVAFCASFLHQHPMKCVRNRLFTVDGMIEDEGKIQHLHAGAGYAPFRSAAPI